MTRADTETPGDAAPADGHLRVLTVNIGNPSPGRARRQALWLVHRTEHVLVLTETKSSRGCALLADELTAHGWELFGRTAPDKAYGTLIATRVPAEEDPWAGKATVLPERTASVRVPTPAGPLRVAGTYVPSRDATPEKVRRKKEFLADYTAQLVALDDVPTVLLGDLNILERTHRPRYPIFQAFEYDAYDAHQAAGLHDVFRHLHPNVDAYSWVGRTGDDYRYDHAFASTALLPEITACEYLDEPRVGVTCWTDHSALRLELARPAPAPLVTSPRPTPDPPDTLF